MKYVYYKHLVRSDLWRITKRFTFSCLLKHITFGSPGFKYCFWLRTCRYLVTKNVFIKYSLYIIAKVFLIRLQNKYGITIPINTNIGPGLYIGHFGGIVISPYANIGANCNINHNVTIGGTFRGARKGYPKIMNNCYIGPGASIIGEITIGERCAIGTNAVVYKPLEPYSVYVPKPGMVLSKNGSREYVINTDYPSLQNN